MDAKGTAQKTTSASSLSDIYQFCLALLEALKRLKSDTDIGVRLMSHYLFELEAPLIEKDL